MMMMMICIKMDLALNNLQRKQTRLPCKFLSEVYTSNSNERNQYGCRNVNSKTVSAV